MFLDDLKWLASVLGVIYLVTFETEGVLCKITRQQVSDRLELDIDRDWTGS